MADTIISSLLLRAPLLPVTALTRGETALRRHPLAELALAHQSEELRGGGDSAAARAARARLLARAAFRPTPMGALAGVMVGELGAKTAVATREVRIVSRASWRTLAALGRELLGDPGFRARARLRRAPSLLLGRDHVLWLATGDAGAEGRAAPLDEALRRLVDATADWIPWGQAPADDETLLELVDAGLLHHDLAPPLGGAEPAAWLAARIGDAARVAALPRDQVVLVHEPRATPTLARAAVERAAALAPLLFRLQQALAPPADERSLDARLEPALDAVREPLGEGAYDLGALAHGDLGASLLPGDEPAAATSAATPPALLALLADALAAAAAAGADEIELDPAALDAVTPAAVPPDSYELMLSPSRRERGRADGDGWLLGLHAPAGASWGRFAEALAGRLDAALADLAAAERAARPGLERLDLRFAPSPALADLAAGPSVRSRALALSHWPAGDALALADLELVVDPSAPSPLALRERATSAPLAPSALSRVRSPLLPAGPYQLLAGWSLWRQHAPWALAAGPLADLAAWPRVRLGGFVIAPRSWRIPDEVAAGRRGALARWRRAARLPRWLQVGHEDELLPIDLRAAGAAAELRRLCGAGAGEARPRAHEIWPPLGREVDAGGRRVEAVVAVVGAADPLAGAADAHTRAAGTVPPPAPAPGWRSYRLHGAGDRAERLLLGAIAPAVRAGLRAREIAAWFFLRYREAGRDQLRLRVRTDDDDHARFEARLRAALAPARDAGDLIALDAGDYLREHARYREAMPAVESLWQADSELAVALLAGVDAPPAELLVVAMDALAAAAGLDAGERLALAARRRDAHGVPRGPADPFAAAYRARGRAVAAALADPPAACARYRARAARALRPLAPARRAALLPALLHLQAARLLGPEPHDEALACTLWERALESLAARARRAAATGSSRS